jgi:hypothetical protein
MSTKEKLFGSGMKRTSNLTLTPSLKLTFTVKRKPFAPFIIAIKTK